jgi:hypothetical protein
MAKLLNLATGRGNKLLTFAFVPRSTPLKGSAALCQTTLVRPKE